MPAREDEIAKLEYILDTVKKELDQVAAESLRGAFRKYPSEFRSSKLAQRHEQLTQKTDEVLDKIAAIRKAMFEPGGEQ